MPKIVAGTGHRPNKLHGLQPGLKELTRDVLLKLQPDHGASGMALGFDMLLAELFEELRIPWTAYVPHPNQSILWAMPEQKRHERLLAKAAKVIMVSPMYLGPFTMHKRNAVMVQSCTDLIVAWDGIPVGGTYNAICIARKLQEQTGIPVIHRIDWDRLIQECLQ